MVDHAKLGNEARAHAMGVKGRAPKKSKFGPPKTEAKIGNTVMTKSEEATPPEVAPSAPAPASELPAFVTEAPSAVHRPSRQPRVPGAKKKVSATVIAWREASKEQIPDASVIHLTNDKTILAKRGKSAERFKFYRDGMTVGEYLAVMNTELKRTKGQTMLDVKWDRAKGFIRIEIAKAEPKAPAA